MHARPKIRPAEPRDHGEFARFFHELGHDDPTPEPARWEAEMMPHTFFLDEGGRNVAYAFCEVFGELGYVRHVVVDPAARGRGVGRNVMAAIAARFRARGCTRWELNVRHDNVPAIRLYERVGMRAQFATSVVKLDWSAVGDLPSDRETVTSSAVDPRDDAGVERDLGLPDGKIAHLRSMQGQVLARLTGTGGGTIGFARFDPSFPGAFPFRVTTPGHVRALLEALRPHRKPELSWLQLVIEDDAESARLLLDVGARLVWEILHMGGAVPQ